MKRVFFLTLALALVSCSHPSERHGEASPASPVLVQTVLVRSEDWPQEYGASGTVRARTSAVLSSRVNANVLEVRAHEGDTVTAGQPLVILDARDLDIGVQRAEAMRAESASALPELEAAIDAAKSNLDLAEVTFRRMSDLYAQKSISPQEFDEAEARLKAARANYTMTAARKAQVRARLDSASQEVQSAAVNRGYTQIAAPFSGTVTVRSVEPGSLATVGSPLLTVERAGAYRLEASVEESKARAIRAGHPVRYTLDSIGCEGSSKVEEMSPATDPLTRSYIVKIPLSCPGAQSGMFGRAFFAEGVRNVLSLPENAVLTRGQLQLALVAEGGVAHLRLLTLGETRSGKVEVLSGLTAGERVIVSQKPTLADGARVEVKP